jgi:mRNA-degrading endonuclease RelE of RelBE toxin-antitoxin system
VTDETPAEPRKRAKASGPSRPAKKSPPKPRARRPKKPIPQPIPELPREPWDAPLSALSRDQLSVFVYVALLPEQTAKLVKDLGLSVPGFRREALGAVQRADLIADEIQARPEARDLVLDLLRADFKVPAFAGWSLSPPAADELLDVLDHEDAYGLVLWRLLCDPDPGVRERALPFLDELARSFFGPASGSGKAPPRKKGDEGSAEELVAELERKLEEARAKAKQEATRAEQRLAEERRRRDEEKEKLQAQLREARAEAAHARDELARARTSAEQAERERERVAAELAAVRREEATVELQRARAQLRDESGRAMSLEGRLERARIREAELESELERARSAARQDGAAPTVASQVADEDLEEAPATWLMPVYSREFYDSLEGWDRRIQRAAFKQAVLLAQDHRHPSLRAIPLEGVPGYYRVRVATDVRLIYRRREQQNSIEILSLIDREDLDRYVKQAKSRG